MNEFDLKASGWDANPVHLERSAAIAEMLPKMIPLNPDMTAMEFGAGTGILSLLLRDRFASVTLLDSSREMVRIMKEKILALGIDNMEAFVVNLEKESFRGKFDIIYSQMVFHHVSDIGGILEKFYGLLNPGGFLAIADLYKEDGSFHDDPFTGHQGFDPDELSKIIAGKRFTDIRHQQCFVIKKTTEGNVMREYPVFLLAGRRG
jgi:tRNA (cmo5U34)-methyltransferase